MMTQTTFMWPRRFHRSHSVGKRFPKIQKGVASLCELVSGNWIPLALPPPRHPGLLSHGGGWEWTEEVISTCVTQMGFTGNWTRQRWKKWNCGCMSHQQLMNTSLSRPTGASKMGIGVSRTSIQFGQQVDNGIMGRHQDMLITTLPGSSRVVTRFWFAQPGNRGKPHAWYAWNKWPSHEQKSLWS